MYTYKEFEIYFSDLNANAQERLLEFVDAKEPGDTKWDVDMYPIAVCVYED